MNWIYIVWLIFVIFVAVALRYFVHDSRSKNIIIKDHLLPLHFDFFLLDSTLKKIQLNFNETIQSRNHRFTMFVAWLISWQHVLLTWVPGSGKTAAVKYFAQLSWLTLWRVQWTPDLMSWDITWSEVFNQKTTEFEFKPWPLFHNIVLVDEINRLSPKVLSWLIQAMAEWQISVWNMTYDLPKPFLVIGTMNPYDQYWTYRLPQAISDRFGFISYQTINDFDPSKDNKSSKNDDIAIDWKKYTTDFHSHYHSLSLDQLQLEWNKHWIDHPTSRQLIMLNDYFNFVRQFVWGN
jgi:midasin (ATPase involved in ribosome maturation)